MGSEIDIFEKFIKLVIFYTMNSFWNDDAPNLSIR